MINDADGSGVAVSASLKLGTPRHFGLREIFLINALGLVFTTPLFLLGLSGIAIFSVALDTDQYILIPVALAAFGGFGAILYFWPALLANPYVRQLVSRMPSPESQHAASYVCQVSFTPRLCEGIRAKLEDADDIGRLAITDDSVSFRGDRVEFVLPARSIAGLSYFNSGWRGLWMLGQRIGVTVELNGETRFIELLERQSNTVFGSRRISDELMKGLEDATGLVATKTSSQNQIRFGF